MIRLLSTETQYLDSMIKDHKDFRKAIKTMTVVVGEVDDKYGVVALEIYTPSEATRSLQPPRYIVNHNSNEYELLSGSLRECQQEIRAAEPDYLVFRYSDGSYASFSEEKFIDKLDSYAKDAADIGAHVEEDDE